MKILIPTQGNGGLDDIVSPVFARAPSFTIVEVEGKEIKKTEVETNTAASGVGGVGIQAAQFAANKGVNVIITGSIGPNASMVLSQAGIQVVTGFQGMKVKDAIENYLRDQTTPQSSSVRLPTVSTQPLYQVKPSKLDIEFEKKMLELEKKMIEERIKYLEKKIKELEKK